MLHNIRVLAVGDHFFIISKMTKTICFKSGHFINIYIINRGYYMAARGYESVLSSSAQSTSHELAKHTSERYLNVVTVVGLYCIKKLSPLEQCLLLKCFRDF